MTHLGPYELNTIVTGDARELVRRLPNRSVDLLVTDPPYFLPVQSYVGTREGGYSKRTLADTSILQTYFDVMFEDFTRVLKPTSSAYVFCDAQSYPIIYRSMYPHFKYVRLIIWDKVISYNGFTWRHQHELIAWGEGEDAERIPTGDGDVLQFRGVLQKDRVHDAEKPVNLLVKLIEKHGQGNIVFDPYGGSGSTGEAAKRTGNHYLLFEYEKNNADSARQRIANAPMPLFILKPEQPALFAEAA